MSKQDTSITAWRKPARSGNGDNCVEVGCIHDATWHKSSRSSGNGACVEAAGLTSAVAVRDSKLPTTGDFPHLSVTRSDWNGLLTAIRSGGLTR